MYAFRRTRFALLGAGLLVFGACGRETSTASRLAGAGAALSEKDFFDPPLSARPSVLWAWLNGYVDRDQLTRELEELKAKGLGGAIIWDVGSLADPKKIIPAGPSSARKMAVKAGAQPRWPPRWTSTTSARRSRTRWLQSSASCAPIFRRPHTT